MTRILVIALVLLLSVGTAACGDDSDTTTTAGDSQTTATSGSDTTSGVGASDTTVSVPPAGDRLFATLCAGCHGTDGKSGFSPDIAGVDEDDVRAAVTQGKGDMAGFGDRLSTAEIDAIVDYVGSLE